MLPRACVRGAEKTAKRGPLCRSKGYFTNVCATGIVTEDTVAEWLRRSTRNRLGLSRVGSSPASVDSFFVAAPLTAENQDHFCLNHSLYLRQGNAVALHQS